MQKREKHKKYNEQLCKSKENTGNTIKNCAKSKKLKKYKKYKKFLSLARYPTSPQRATELNMWPWYSAFAVVSPQLDSSSARRWGSLAGEKLVEGGRFEETRDVFLFA